MKILIIDDMDAARNIYKQILFKENIETFEASSGNEGLENFKKYSPDVIILDIDLPDINGVEVLKEIRNIDNNVTVIMITSYSDHEHAAKGLKTGADLYLVKPVDPLSVVEYIKEIKETIA